MDMKSLIADPSFLFLIGFLGMIAHFLKKFQADELKIPSNGVFKVMLSYFFGTDLINTMLAIISYIVLFFIMYQQQALNVFAVFSAGFMCDSLLNKAEQKGISV